MKLGESLVSYNDANYYDRDDIISSEFTRNKNLWKFRLVFTEMFDQISNVTKNTFKQEFTQ